MGSQLHYAKMSVKVPPDRVSFNSAIAAAVKAGMFESNRIAA